MDTTVKKFKVAMLFICLNPSYWEFVGRMIESCRQHFLKGHQVDYFLWTDMPDTDYGATVFPTEPVVWPLPTLMRYHLFLQQEEKLREYDYIFYADADLLMVDTVGDEILGKGLTAACHPMYQFRPGLSFPIDTNPESEAYIRMPKFYAAGGFQGGKTDIFLNAMKVMKRAIDKDFCRNYVARWNDESHWNRYLYDNPEIPLTLLDTSYVYPDSLINEYYIKIWGKDFKPKIITLTKKFASTKEGGQAITEQLKTW